jgi:integrase
MATLDVSGQYRRDLGWKLTRSGKRAQQRFYLGRDKNHARVGETRLEAFWNALEGYFAAERKGESPLWEEWSLEIGAAIADGKMVIAPPPPPAALVALFPDDPDVASAGWLDILQTHFAGVVGFSGVASFAYRGQGEFDKPKPIHTGHTLHSAVDAYVEYLHQVHRTPEQAISQTGKKQGERAIRLKHHHPDFPLYDLTAKKIEEILFYWGKRPLHAKEKRYSRDTCKNQLILIRAFLRWLHRSDMKWQLPTAYLFPRIKIEWLPSEVSSEVKKRTFTMKQVGILWKHATPLERVFIALGINCGFGTAEIGTLAEAEINGSVIKRLRHKTKVFGAWWLFPITRKAIEWARKRKEVLGFTSHYLLVSDSGRPYSAVTAGNNNNQKIRNSWSRLMKRVRQEKDNSDFPRLSFGKLRKTAASWMRRVGGGEMSSIFIAHGKATGDSLLDLYADRQFRKLFKCQKRIWEKVKSVLTGEFPEPKPHKPTSHRHEDSLKKRIQKLKRQGYKLAAIAKMTDTPFTTVSRIASAKALDSDTTTGEQ